jgi:hypothetical protein
MNYLQKTAALAVIQALVDHSRVPVGRLKARLQKIEKQVAKKFGYLPRITNDERSKLVDLIMDFEQEMDWQGKDRHVLSYINFILGILEEYPVVDTMELQEMQRYFERVDADPPGSYDEGARAAELFLGKLEKLA